LGTSCFRLDPHNSLKRVDCHVTAQEDKTTGMPGRYATALFELAQEAKAVDQVSADLDSFAAMLDGSEDLTRLVRSPVFGAAEQVAALDAILARQASSRLRQTSSSWWPRTAGFLLSAT
jgi:hypothetical protein